MPQATIQDVRKLASEGKLKEALDQGKALFNEDPQNEELRTLLMEIQDSMMLQMQVDALLQKATSAIDNGDRDTALKILKEVSAIDPGNEKAAKVARRLSGDAEGLAESEFDETELMQKPVEPPTGDSTTSEELPELDSLEALEMPEELEAPAGEQTVMEHSGSTLAPEEEKKVSEYIEKGKELLAKGDYEEAIDSWTRVFIIDENNKQAQQLIDEARETVNKQQKDIEPQLAEGIAAYNAGDFEKSRKILDEILAIFPSHREALYYLEQIDKKEIPGAEDSGDEFELIQPEDAEPVLDSPSDDEPSEFVFGEDVSPDDIPAPSTDAASDSISSEASEFVFGEDEDASEAPASPPSSPHADEQAFTIERSSYSSDDAPGETAGTDQSDDSGGFGFELETNAADQSGSSTDEESSGGDPGFVLETGAADEFEAPASNEQMPDKTPESEGVEGLVEDESPLPDEADMPGQEIDGEFPARPGAEPEAPAKSSKMSSHMIFALIVIALLIIGLGIFFAARIFLGGGSDSDLPLNQPKQTKVKKPKKKPVTQPDSEPIKQPVVLTVEELAQKAREAYQAGNYGESLALYQKIQDKSSTQSPELLANIREAQMAYTKQKLEEEKRQKFLKELAFSEKSCHEGDYPEALRVAWRLIYPDDSLAKEMGKKERIRKILIVSYFNWALSDLKKENVTGAMKNLQDLLDFSPSDSEARKVMGFIRAYKTQRADESYWAYISAIPSRQLPLEEEEKTP